MERATRTSGPTPDTSGWHYRDARGRACGPYDAEALARLYRFGHLRADSEIWRPGEARPPTPLRSRRDAFRLHDDGRLEALLPALPGAHAPGVADRLAAPRDASAAAAVAPLSGAAKGPAPPAAQCHALPAARCDTPPAAADAGAPPAPHAAADARRPRATAPATTDPPIAPAAKPAPPPPRYRRALAAAAAVFVAALAAARLAS